MSSTNTRLTEPKNRRTDELKNRRIDELAESWPSGQHFCKFVDSPSLKPRRGIAACARIAIQPRSAEIAHHVQPGMRFAFHREQFIADAEMLFKNRYAKGIPEQVSIVIGESRLALVGERDHCMLEFQAALGEKL